MNIFFIKKKLFSADMYAYAKQIFDLLHNFPFKNC